MSFDSIIYFAAGTMLLANRRKQIDESKRV